MKEIREMTMLQKLVIGLLAVGVVGVFCCLCTQVASPTERVEPLRPSPTETPEPSPTETPEPSPTETPVPEPTATPTQVPPTATPTRVLPTPTPTRSPLQKLLFTYNVLVEEECYGLVCIDTCADDVLLIRGQGLQTAILGDDWWGLVVAWFYEDAMFVFGWRQRDGVTCYRVIGIYLKGQ